MAGQISLLEDEFPAIADESLFSFKTTRREDIQDLLSSRFGEKSTDIQNQVQLLDDVKALHSLLRQLFSVNTMEEARGIVQDAVRKSTPQNKAVKA